MIDSHHLFYGTLGYFLGSIPSGYIFGKLVLNKDISITGSTTIGAANVFRLSSLKLGVVVFLIDSLGKGLIPLLLISVLTKPSLFFEYANIFTLSALIGHNWSIFLKFKGGRGQSLIIGSLIILSIPLTIIMLFTLFTTWLIFKDGGPSWLTTLFILMITCVTSITITNNLPLTISIIMYLIITLIKRITANKSIKESKINNNSPIKTILLYRLILDRDVPERS